MDEDAKARLAIQSDDEFAGMFAPHRICDKWRAVFLWIWAITTALLYLRKVRSGKPMSAGESRVGW